MIWSKYKILQLFKPKWARRRMLLFEQENNVNENFISPRLLSCPKDNCRGLRKVSLIRKWASCESIPKSLNSSYSHLYRQGFKILTIHCVNTLCPLYSVEAWF